ncbi:MAG: hypothetical protein KF683_00620 [Rubrivivax sp.]|nr:hypothetical protein [Rubrivivax sp.]
MTPLHKADAADDAYRARGQEVARDHAHGALLGHRRAWQALVNGGLDLKRAGRRGLARGIQRHRSLVMRTPLQRRHGPAAVCR